ncbi:hypothetical protein BC830DRAFT_1224696 [Chytriomyces sp. MP71]|nr:hypothetical protein BC830DRAFT_1224696 [Chytriomyces sp. MP71]
MSLSKLPIEVLERIFLSCATLEPASRLAQSCARLARVFQNAHFFGLVCLRLAPASVRIKASHRFMASMAVLNVQYERGIAFLDEAREMAARVAEQVVEWRAEGEERALLNRLAIGGRVRGFLTGKGNWGFME